MWPVTFRKKNVIKVWAGGVCCWSGRWGIVSISLGKSYMPFRIEVSDMIDIWSAQNMMCT
jgi:hypothetical protein